MEANATLGQAPTVHPKDPRLGTIDTVWKLHSAAWALFRSNFGSAAMIGLLTLLVPFLLLNYFEPWTWSADYPKFWRFVAMADVYGLVGALSSPALYHIALERLKTGRSPGLGAAFGYAARQWARVFGCRFVAGLLIMAGTLLLVVPGAVLAVRYSLVTPLAALELDPEVDVLKRSAVLVRGRAWLVFGAYLLVYLGSLLLVLVASAGLGVLYSLACFCFASLPHVAMLDDKWILLACSYTSSGILTSALPLLSLAAYLNWRAPLAEVGGAEAAVSAPPAAPLPSGPAKAEVSPKAKGRRLRVQARPAAKRKAGPGRASVGKAKGKARPVRPKSVRPAPSKRAAKKRA
jgi:hypothetical protein